jgi:hypothetical protein
MLLRQSVAAVTAAAQLGDFFQYVVEKPLTLPRQKSALLPIIGKDVEATRVSVYNERTQPKFPLLGLRLKNTSGLHLMQGPITVFEGSSYASDARIADLQPNEERLLSYAVDLGTEVKPEVAADSGRLTQVKVVKGVLHSTAKVREKQTYTVKNRNPEDRLVLIEHAIRQPFKLVDTGKPAETARDVYCFELKVPAGETAKQTVTEERDLTSRALLTNSPDEQVHLFLQSPVVSAKVKEGLRKAQGLRREWARAQREVGGQQRQLQAVAEDQARLRANLREVPQSSPLHRRYLDKPAGQSAKCHKRVRHFGDTGTPRRCAPRRFRRQYQARPPASAPVPPIRPAPRRSTRGPCASGPRPGGRLAAGESRPTGQHPDLFAAAREALAEAVAKGRSTTAGWPWSTSCRPGSWTSRPPPATSPAMRSS